MAARDDDDLLATWLQRVSAVSEGEPRLSEHDFRQIASELGLGADELARVEAIVAAHLARGQNFQAHGRPADAVAELAQAQALAPWRGDIGAALAAARVALYEETGDRVDRAAAEAAVRGVLARSPDHQPAFALLNRLDAPPAIRTSPRRARRNALFIALAGVLLIVTLSGIIAGLFQLVPPPAGPNGPVPAPADPGAAPLPPLGVHPLPFEVVGDGVDLAAIDFDPSDTRIDRREGHTAAHLELRVIPRAEGRALQALAGTLELLDGAGQVLVAEPLSLIDSATVPRRAGEGLAWGKQVSTRREATHARLRVSATGWATDAAPVEATPACVVWDITKPAHVDVDIEVRAHRLRGISLVADYAIHNRGQRALEDFTFVVEHRDATGAPLTAPTLLDRRMVAGAWRPPFEPGEVRLERHTKVMPEPDRARHASTCLRVTEAY